MPSQNIKILLSARTWIVVFVFMTLYGAFGLYVYTEKRIDKAYEQRLISYQLADELRQSSDDLTRMVRSYVVTGEPRYKTYFQNILDIRKGLIPRPAGYAYNYWHLVVAGDLPPPQAYGKGQALLELMRQAGFTDDEFSQLAIAQKNSDALTGLEFKAMALSESSIPDVENNRAMARQMLFGDEYHQAKSKIMQPINQCFHMMEERTNHQVNQAIYRAYLFRLMFMATTVWATLLLWRTYSSLKRTLGGTAEELHKYMYDIGQGNFSTEIPIAKGLDGSVLAGLSAMQNVLKDNAEERQRSARALEESAARMQALFDTKAISILVIDHFGIIQQFNKASEALFGYASAEVIGHNVNILMPEPYRSNHDAYIKRYLDTGVPKIIGQGRELIGQRKDGSTFLMELLVGDAMVGQEHHFIGFVQDITERKRLAETGKLFELVVRSSDDAIVTNQLDGTITSWNPGAEALFGYSAEEMIGQSVLTLFPPDRLDEEEGILTKIRHHEQVRHLETMRKRKDGSLFDVSLTLSPILDDQGVVIGISTIVRDISERKKSEHVIHNLAFYDPLTDLPNRRLFQDRLTIAIASSVRNKQYGALMFLDLDNFKTLNDTQGHDVGDLLLIEVAKRLKSCVRESDTVARMGGDEFIVLIEGLGSHEEYASQVVAHVAEKMRESLAQPYQLNNIHHQSSPSIGVYIFSGAKDALEDVIKRADIAMYQAKNSGRNRVRFYDPELQKLVEYRAAMEADLSNAVFERQLQLHYQIQVDRELRPLGAEALIRWHHPQRGVVSPAEFIPIAEETALIQCIGDWVVETACQQLANWAQRDDTRHLILAINVSAKQFKQSNFVEIIQSKIDKYKIDPSLLKLELTESLALHDIDFVIAKMHALKNEVGVRLSLDDFGTGYSSLSYLKRLPLNQVKIDQSFVRDVKIDTNDAVMVKTIIDMAHNFGLDVIAEGVETEDQLVLLKEFGCMAYQGYLFSKPLTLDAFEKLLSKQDPVCVRLASPGT